MLSVFDDDRQSEIVNKTGNTYVTGTITVLADNIEILTTNLGFTIKQSSKMCRKVIAIATDNRK